MGYWATLTIEGYPDEYGAVPDGYPLPAGATEFPRAVSPTACLVDGKWVERPTLFPPELVGRRLTWLGLPPGTLLRVEDNEVAAVVGETEDVEIDFPPEPNSYVVTALPPAPWLPRRVLVEVS